MREIWFTVELATELVKFVELIRKQECDVNLVASIARSWNGDESEATIFGGGNSIDEMGASVGVDLAGMKVFIAEGILRDAPSGALVFSLGHRDSLHVLLNEKGDFLASKIDTKVDLIEGKKY